MKKATTLIFSLAIISFQFFIYYDANASSIIIEKITSFLNSDSSENFIPTTDVENLEIIRPNKSLEGIVVNEVKSNTKCYGSKDGSISFTISGGVAPYTYSWSNGTSGKLNGSKWNLISITNPGPVLSDYQTMIQVSYLPGMKSDFSDIIFSDISNNNLYSFWLEQSVATTTATFWVKIPSLPIGTTTIKMSYGNPDAISLSNGYTTFEYFDDFNDANISDWIYECQTAIEPDEYCDTNMVKLSESNYAIALYAHTHCNGTGPQNTGARSVIKKILTIPAGIYKLDVSTYMRSCLHTSCTGATEVNAYGYLGPTYVFGYYLAPKDSCHCRLGNPNFQARSNAYTSTNTPTEYMLQALAEDCGEGEMRFDNFRIRKFFSDPIVSIIPQTYQELKLDSLIAGEYTITVTDATGAIYTKTITISQPDPPSVQKSSRCGAGTFTFTATGSYGTYYWYNSKEGGILLDSSTTFTTDTLFNNTTYYLSGKGSNGCISKPRTSVFAEVMLPTKDNNCLTIYSGISPNKDGLNDGWIIDGIENYPNNEVYIFDRWGNIVFESKGYNNSNKLWKGKSNKGTLKEQELPAGQYLFEIRIDGLESPFTGFVSLNREN